MSKLIKSIVPRKDIQHSSTNGHRCNDLRPNKLWYMTILVYRDTRNNYQKFSEENLSDACSCKQSAMAL